MNLRILVHVVMQLASPQVEDPYNGAHPYVSAPGKGTHTFFKVPAVKVPVGKCPLMIYGKQYHVVLAGRYGGDIGMYYISKRHITLIPASHIKYGLVCGIVVYAGKEPVRRHAHRKRPLDRGIRHPADPVAVDGYVQLHVIRINTRRLQNFLSDLFHCRGSKMPPCSELHGIFLPHLAFQFHERLISRHIYLCGKQLSRNFRNMKIKGKQGGKAGH